MGPSARLIGLCLFALLLSALTLTWEFEKLDCVADYCAPNSHAILVVDLPEHQLASTGAIVASEEIPAGMPVVDGGIGLYARWGLPGWIGGLVGVVIPLTLLAWAWVLWRRQRDAARL